MTNNQLLNNYLKNIFNFNINKNKMNYELNIQKENKITNIKMTRDQLLELHNQITNTLQSEVMNVG